MCPGMTVVHRCDSSTRGLPPGPCLKSSEMLCRGTLLCLGCSKACQV